MTFVDAISNPMVWLAVGGWAAREFWLRRQRRHDKIDERFEAHEKKLADAITAFNKGSAEMTMAIVKLTVQMEHMNKMGEQMPKVVQDLTALHAKVRELSQ
jgi:hypothetical protein